MLETDLVSKERETTAIRLAKQIDKVSIHDLSNDEEGHEDKVYYDASDEFKKEERPTKRVTLRLWEGREGELPSYTPTNQEIK